MLSQILMLSGIGPKAHLQDVGITPVLDLPGVGQRLHDHMFASGQVTFRLSKTAKIGTVQHYVETVKQYVQKRAGPLSATSNPVRAMYTDERVATVIKILPSENFIA